MREGRNGDTYLKLTEFPKEGQEIGIFLHNNAFALAVQKIGLSDKNIGPKMQKFLQQRLKWAWWILSMCV